MDRSDEHSAFAWIMSGAVGVVVAGGIGKALLALEKNSEELAREAVRLAGHKLPIETKFVKRA